MRNNQHKQKGSSLIEVLITLLVFAIGMLGMATLQLNALQGTADSAQRSQSTWILQDIAERIRANPQGSIANYATAPNCAALPANRCADYYNPATGAKVNATSCDAAEMAAFDRWEAQCSYSAIAAFNTIDGRFSSRDFLTAPADGLTLTVAAAGNTLSIVGRWLGKGDDVTVGDNCDPNKIVADKVSQTCAVQVVR